SLIEILALTPSSPYPTAAGKSLLCCGIAPWYRSKGAGHGSILERRPASFSRELLVRLIAGAVYWHPNRPPNCCHESPGLRFFRPRSSDPKGADPHGNPLHGKRGDPELARHPEARACGGNNAESTPSN